MKTSEEKLASVGPADEHSKVAELKWVIFPDNRAIQVWDQLILVLLLIQSLTIPFQLGVVSASTNADKNSAALGFIITLLFVIDTVLMFFKAYEDRHGNMKVFRSTIQYTYLRSWFIVDILACFPADLIIAFARGGADAQALRWLKFFELLRLLRLVRAQRILRNATWWRKFTLRTYSVVRSILKYLFGLFLLNHWFACFWCMVALLEAGSFEEEALLSIPNWIQKFHNNVDSTLEPLGNDSSANVFDRYVLALYWSVMTVTSIGYGDVTPMTSAEFWVVSFVMLIGGIMWAYIIGSAVTIAATVNESKDRFNSEMDLVNNIIRVNPAFDASKASSIRRFLYSKYHSLNSAASRQNDVLPLLSSSLQMELQMSTTGLWLQNVKMFSSLFSSTRTATDDVMVLRRVFEGTEVEYYAQDEALSLREKRGIRIVKAGLLVGYDSRSKELMVMDKGVVLGEPTVFLKDDSPLLSDLVLRALIYTEILFIPREVVLEAAESAPAIWKHGRWHIIKQQLCHWAKAEKEKESRERDITSGRVVGDSAALNVTAKAADA